MNYEKDLAIDRDRLDWEWLNQPQLFFRYARAATEAKTQADAAKERLELTRANLDSSVRGNPDKWGLSKPTEAAISSAILRDEGYQDEQKVLAKAQADAALLAVAVRAMEQRKSALENLVRLHGQDYFSTPREPDNAKEEVRERIKDRSNQQMVSGMKAAAERRRRVPRRDEEEED